MNVRSCRSRRVSLVLLTALVLQLFPVLPARADGAVVTLSPTASPSSGQPGVHVVSVTGSGFPAGAIDPAAVNVRLSPAPPASGPSALTRPISITTIVGSTRRASFLVPSNLVVTDPTSYRVTLDGATTAGAAFQSGNASALVINPPASIASVAPDRAFQGASTTVTVTAQFTNFVQGSTQASFGPGIHVGGAAAGVLGPVTVVSATQVQAQIAVDANAALGGRTVQVKTGAQDASKASAFLVLGPVVSALEPAQLTVAAGGNGNLTVHVQDADPSRDTHVAIGSADPAVASVPSDVVLPAGANSGLVPVSGGVPGGPTSITASLNGSSATAEVTVRERPVPPSLTEPLVDGALTVSGTGIANALVDILVDSSAAGSGTVASDGQFSVAVSALHAGQIVTATQTVDVLISLPSAPVTVRARPPAPTVTAPLLAGSTQVSGTAVANAAVDLFVNGAPLASGIAAVSGAFVIPVPALLSGQQITATQTVAGVTSIPSAPVTVVDVPPAPSVTAPLVEGAVVITGTGVAGASVEAFVDDSSVGTTLVGGSNLWSLSIGVPLIAGQHVKARQTIAGITSDFSAVVIVVSRPPKPTIDSPLVDGSLSISGTGVVAASVRVFIDAAPAGTTTVGAGGTWALSLGSALVAGQVATADQTVGGVLSAVSDPVMVVARPPAPTIAGPLVEGSTSVSGTATPNATVDLFVAGVSAGSATATGGAWTVTLGSALVSGQAVRARQTVAGIASDLSAPVIVVSRPPAPTITAPVIAGAMTVQGTGVVGASVEVFVDAASRGTTSVNGSGAWSLPLGSALVAGQVITAQQTVAGVTSPLSAPVTVQAALVSIEVTPAPTATLTVGDTLPFSARGVFSDASVLDPLPGVSWSSDASNVASIDTTGLATAAGAGIANIRATLGAITSSPTALTVKPIAPVVGAPITAGAITVSGGADAGASVQVFVNGAARGAPVLANGSGQWTAAGLSPALALNDSVTARQTVNGVQSDPSAPVIVISGTPTLTSIVVSPASLSVAAGTIQAYTATGLFSNGSSQDITAQVTWQSDHPPIASITAGGSATALDAGSATISASKSGVNGSTSLTVTPATVASIVVAPATPSILTAQTQAFTATGVLTNGTSKSLAGQVVWSSSNTTAATINSSSGVATGAAAGSTNVIATLGSITGSTTLTVAARVTDATPPTVAITTPVNNATITSPTNVVGTANDANFLKYVLEFAPAGTTTFTTFATGTTAVVGAVLGKFDPTTLLNDVYTVRLTVFDKGGNTASTSANYSVTRDEKVGNFTLSFEDLKIPAPGVPLTVTRLYDSRDKRVGDFGFGWRLDIRSLSVRANRVQGDAWQVNKSGGILPTYTLVGTDQHKISVTLPGGKVEDFDLTITPSSQQILPLDFGTASYVPRVGTVGTLRILSGDGTLISGSEPGPVQLLDTGTFDIFDPTQFEYTSKDGTKFVIDKTAGVLSARDLNGNTLTFGPNGITHSAGQSVTFTRDGLGRITTIKDSSNHTHTYAYDANGDLSSYTDPQGNATRFFYNLSHGVIEVRNPLGLRPIRNEYDADGRLVRNIDPFGNVVNYLHDLNARQEVITDRLGHVTIHEYDNQGNILRQTAADGGATTRTFDANGNVLTEMNPLGKTHSFTYDSKNNRLTETDPLGKTTTFTYNSLNQALTLSDALSHVTSSAYDANGNVTSTTDALGKVTTYTYNARGQKLSMTDPLSGVTTYAYDAAGNLTNITDALGHSTTYTYDGLGNRLTETKTQTTSGGPRTLVTRYEYDERSRLTKTTFPDNSTTRVVYNSIGKQAATFDQLGRETDFTYDDLGRLAKTTYPDGLSESSTYDAEGRKISSTDRAGRITQFEYDPVGRPTKTTYPDGTFSTIQYDLAGQIVRLSDARGNVTSYTYDDAGRRSSVTDALLHVTSFTYDAVGNLTSVKDANNNTVQYQYDNDNRRSKATYPDSTSDQIAYDAVGQSISKTDQAGRVTQYQYDKLGRLTKVIDALSQQTAYAYDELGYRVTQLDANSHQTRYEYDAFGHRTRRTLPLGMSESLTYDSAGNLVSRVDFNGKTTTYTYDVLNRLTSKVPDATLSEPTVQFNYSSTGRRTQMVDASGTTTYSYDLRDRLSTKTTPQGALTYTYDAAGNVATLRSSNAAGTSVDYAYDPLNRLTTATDNRLGSSVTTYAYDTVGSLASVAYPNSVTHTYTYNSLNRLTTLALANGSGPIASYGYTLGPAGNRTAVAELGGRHVDYVQDAIYRLTAETIGGAAVAGAVGYTYDAVGNRTARTSTVGPVGPSVTAYDANDRVGTDGYDSNGNTIASSGALYAYDFEDHLKGVNSGAVTLLSDGDGNRAAKTFGGVTTRYLVDDRNPTGFPQVVEEVVGGVVQRAYTYGLTRISERQSGGTSYYGYDGHGSVRALTDAAGNVTDRYDYDAFGIVVNRVGTTANDFLFAGEQFDSDIGLYYNRARYLNVRTGRFWSMDRVDGNDEEPLSLHKYLYVNADPVNRVDPSGNQSLGEIAIGISIQVQLFVMAHPLLTGIVALVALALAPEDFLNALPPNIGGEGLFIQGIAAEAKELTVVRRAYEEARGIARMKAGKDFERWMIEDVLRNVLPEAEQLVIKDGEAVVGQARVAGSAVIDAIYRNVITEFKTSFGAVKKYQLQQFAQYAERQGLSITYTFLVKPAEEEVLLLRQWAAEVAKGVEVTVNYVIPR